MLVGNFTSPEILNHTICVISDADYECAIDISPRGTIKLLEDGNCSSRCGLSVSSEKFVDTSLLVAIKSIRRIKSLISKGQK